jgi:hypothetical protein
MCLVSSPTIGSLPSMYRRVPRHVLLWCLGRCRDCTPDSENPELQVIFYRLARYLGTNIILLFVFDGPGRPPIKRATHVITASHWLTEPIKELVTVFGFQCHMASLVYIVTCCVG